MTTINVKFIHPTNNSDVDVGIPEDMLLRDVISQLIEASFISAGQTYNCVLFPNGDRTANVLLDNGKTIHDNGISNNDLIKIILASELDGGLDRVTIPQISKKKIVNAKIIHPTNNSDIDVGIPEETILEDVFSQLIEANFLSSGQSYSGVLRSTEGRYYDAPLDNSKTVLENGIANNDTILTVLSTKAGGGIDYFTTLWQSIYPYLDQLGTILQIAGTAVGIGVWLKKKFSQRYSPDEFISLVTSKELWNSHELSMKLAISNEEAKDLLKGLGYKWNRTFAMFVKTDRTIEILESINDYLKK